MSSKQQNYYLNEKVIEKVKKNAEKEGRSKSDVANRALAKELKVKI